MRRADVVAHLFMAAIPVAIFGRRNRPVSNETEIDPVDAQLLLELRDTPILACPTFHVPAWMSDPDNWFIPPAEDPEDARMADLFAARED